MSVSFRLRQGYGGPAKALATAGRLASQAKVVRRSRISGEGGTVSGRSPRRSW